MAIFNSELLNYQRVNWDGEQSKSATFDESKTAELALSERSEAVGMIVEFVLSQEISIKYAHISTNIHSEMISRTFDVHWLLKAFGPKEKGIPCETFASCFILHGLHLDQRSSFYGAKDLRSRWVGGNGLVLWHLELEELASRGPKATRSSDAWEALEEARCFSGEGGPFALSIAPSGEAEKVQAWSSKPSWQRGLGSEDDPPLMLHRDPPRSEQLVYVLTNVALLLSLVLWTAVEGLAVPE